MSRLKNRLIERIQSQGPISVAEYMSLCLLDPKDGYYPTRDPLGSDGDFITAPEISQMFGELIGLWAVQTWQDMDQPETVYLVELGPGRGIMMADMLRAARLDPGFLKAAKVILIEASAALEAVQAKTLAESPVPVSWEKDIASLPDGPSIIIGNEFLDCLPIRQFIQTDRFAGAAGWTERVITISPDDPEQLIFAKSPETISEPVQTTLPSGQEDARNDDLLEVCPATLQIVDQLQDRFSRFPGRALFVDYGPENTEFGDTLQALKRHEKVGVFSDPGNTDLTARVDFSAFLEAAHAQSLAAAGPVTQREFLSKLGLELRAVTLTRAAPDAKEKIARQLHRLTASEEMGELFKAVCVQSYHLAVPLGFREMAK